MPLSEKFNATVPVEVCSMCVMQGQCGKHQGPSGGRGERGEGIDQNLYWSLHGKGKAEKSNSLGFADFNNSSWLGVIGAMLSCIKWVLVPFRVKVILA